MRKERKPKALRRLTEEEKAEVERNRGLVVDYVDSRPFLYRSRDDCVQAGMFGLFRAVQKYRPEKGFAFSTYAMFWIRRCVRDHLYNDRMIRLPDWVASTTDWEAIDAGAKSRSLDAIRNHEGESFDPGYTPPDLMEFRGDNTIEDAVNLLPWRYAVVIRRIYWDGRSQVDVAAELGVTCQRVGQLKFAALERLRLRLKSMAAA